MKILIVSQYYYPEQFQINEIAPELVKRGHDVTVLTGLPNYPQGEIYSGYEKNQRKKEIIDGVKVIRVEEHPRKKGIKNLILNYMSFYINATLAVKRIRNDYDVVLCYQLSPVTMLKPAVTYAKKYKKPLLTYCLDIWPESAKDHMNMPVVYSIISMLSKRLYKSCDHIVVTSRPFIDYFEEVIGFDKNKLSYIPQHADTSMLDYDLTASENDVADFMYAGNMGKGQTLDVIVRAVAELKNRDDFVVHMVGDGSRKDELEELSAELGISDKIVFYGNQNRDCMPEFYKKADALLITLRGNNAVGNTMPGKLQMYMTTGKPIFGAINGAANEVITESACGKCVAAGDYKGLAVIMADYIDNTEKYEKCGENGKRYFAEKFTLEKYCDNLEGQLKRMVEDKSMKMKKLIRGRALYTEDNRIWIAQGMSFFAIDYSGKRITKKYTVGGIKEKIISCNRVSRQLFRQGLHHLLPLPNGDVFVTAKKIAYVVAEDGSVKYIFKGYLGNKPGHQGICVTPDGTIFFGEYTLNPKRDHDTHLYRSRDGGKTFEIVLTLKKNEVRHIHFIKYDPYEKCIWLGTGDEDFENLLMRSFDNGDTWQTIGKGSQDWRAIGLCFDKEALTWGTDAGSVPDQNHIIRMDRKTHEIEIIHDAEGPCHGCGSFKDGRVFISTGVEGGENEKDRNARLKVVKDGKVNTLLERKKDIWPLIFQYGVIRFPLGTENTDIVVYTMYGLKGNGEQVYVENC